MVGKPDEILPTGKYDTHGTPVLVRNFWHHVPTVEISLKRNGENSWGCAVYPREALPIPANTTERT